MDVDPAIKMLPNCHAGGKDGTSLPKFQMHMNDVKASEKCENHCYPNCEETAYVYSLSVTTLNTQELCLEGTDTRKVCTYLK